MIARFVASSVLTVLLAGCASASNTPSATPIGAADKQAQEPQLDPCDASALGTYKNLEATIDRVETMRKASGSDMARVLKPGQMISKEYRYGRLSVRVDEKNVIVDASCG